MAEDWEICKEAQLESTWFLEVLIQSLGHDQDPEVRAVNFYIEVNIVVVAESYPQLMRTDKWSKVLIEEILPQENVCIPSGHAIFISLF